MSLYLGLLTYLLGVVLVVGYPLALWLGWRNARSTTETRPPTEPAYEVQVEERI